MRSHSVCEVVFTAWSVMIIVDKEIAQTHMCVVCLSVSPLFFLESLWSFSLSCFSAPGDSGMSSSMASSDSQAWRGHRYRSD